MHDKLIPAASLVRALRLLEPSLEWGGDEDEGKRLARALLGKAGVDEERIAREIVEVVLRHDRDPFEGLLRLADDLVELSEGVPRCKEPALWHLVCGEFDTDLVVAAKLSAYDRSCASGVEWVKALAWPSVLASVGFAVDNVLSREIVDTHVHLGGALPGSFYWISCMAGFARTQRLAGWAPDDPELWIERVERAREGRLSLLSGGVGVPGRRAHDDGSRAPPPGYVGPEPTAEEPFCDPIFAWLVPSAEQRHALSPVLGERYLLHALLRDIRFGRAGDARAILEYLRTRASFIRYLSHGPGYRGLERFQTTFRRQHLVFDDRVRGDRRREARRRRALRSALVLERFRVRHALRYQFSDPTDAPWARDQGAGLEGLDVGSIPYSPWRPARQIELRVTPVVGHSQLRVLHAQLQGVHDFVRGEPDAPPIRVGFVFHVHRHLAPHEGATAEWQIEGILSLLDDVPMLRPFVVGVDAAGAEMLAPPRDLARCYRIVAEHVKSQRARPGTFPVRLGLTCHAGEDFRDLLTGLRYVDEAVSLLGLRPGDRLGHGLALAIDPRAWYGQRSMVYPRYGDHVMDLVWGRFLARRHDSEEGLVADAELDDAIELRLRRALDDAHPQRASRAVLDRVEDALADLDEPARFLRERDVLAFIGLGAACAVPYPVEVEAAYVDQVVRLRRRALKRIQRAEVVVEACPTSNLLVGGFLSYEKLPYLNLNHAHIGGTEADDPRIPLSINSDDPGLFQTTVANEYRLLGEALVKQRHRRWEVAAWLEEARRVGVESTFIPRWSPPTRSELFHWLAQLGIPPHP